MSRPRAGPPRLAEWLLARCLPRGGVRDGVLGDLHEIFLARAAERSGGRTGAALWYWRHAAAVGGGYLLRRLRRAPVGTPAAGHTSTTDGVRRGEMGDVVRDVRYALRGLARAPAFAAVALLSLALAIGANSAIFSVIDALYLRPLDFREPDRLVRVGQSALDGTWRMSTQTAGTWSDWNARQTSFEAFAGYRFWTTTVERDGRAARVTSVHSLGSIFDVLGVPALLGRTFTAAEEGPGPERLVVLSHAYWRQEFGEEDPTGRSLLIDGAPHVILGVMPPTFRFPTPGTMLWKTSDLSAEELLDRDDHFVNALGRLAPGRTLEQASDEMARVHAELRAAFPSQLANTTPELVGLRDVLIGGAGPLWATLMGAVVLVLLVACLNLANLLLSRGAAREVEMSVRRALGASAGRVTRLVVVESLTLSFLGGLAGLGTGWLLLRGILAWMPGGVPRAEAIGFDARVVAFTLLVTAAAGVLFGVVPALRAAGAGLGGRIRLGRRGSTQVIRRSLVVAEVSLAVVLTTAAGLTLRGFAAVTSLTPGFDPTDRTVVDVALPGDAADGVRDLFYRDLERALADVPGVRAAGVTSVFPMSGFTPGAWVGAPGVPVPSGDDNPTLKYVGVTPGFRRAAGIPLLRGRDLAADDGRGGTPALLLSESAARRLFPGEDALGRTLYLGPDGVVAPVSTVIGIVGDVRQSSLAQEPPAMAYVARGDIAFWRGFQVVVEADRAGEAIVDEVRRVAGRLDADAVVLGGSVASDYVAGTTRDQRNVVLLFGLLAAVALVIAMVGVFGVVAYLVSRRTREIGIRMAVGAAREEVQALVVRQSLVPVALGAALGVVAAAGLSRFMEGVVIGVAPTDPPTFVAVPLLLIAIGALASWVPARRAARVDPVRVLGAE